MSLITVLRFISPMWTLFLVVFGTLSNLTVAIVIASRKNLRSVPTFVFTAFGTTIETLALYGTNLNNFYWPYYGKVLESESELFCNISIFLHYFPLQTSAWLLISMSLERLLSIKIKKWRSRLFSAKKAVIMSSGITIFFAVLNFHLNFSADYNKPGLSRNGSTAFTFTACVARPIRFTWATVNLYVYSIIPFILLAIINLLLIYYSVVRRSTLVRPTSQQRMKRKSLTISVISITLSYIVMTSPIAIAGGYFLQNLSKSEEGNYTLALFSSLRFSFHSFNILVLLIFNKAFRLECKNMFEELCKKKNSRVGTTTGAEGDSTDL